MNLLAITTNTFCSHRLPNMIHVFFSVHFLFLHNVFVLLFLLSLFNPLNTIVIHVLNSQTKKNSENTIFYSVKHARFEGHERTTTTSTDEGRTANFDYKNIPCQRLPHMTKAVFGRNLLDIGCFCRTTGFSLLYNSGLGHFLKGMDQPYCVFHSLLQKYAKISISKKLTRVVFGMNPSIVLK